MDGQCFETGIVKAESPVTLPAFVPPLEFGHVSIPLAFVKFAETAWRGVTVFLEIAGVIEADVIRLAENARTVLQHEIRNPVVPGVVVRQHGEPVRIVRIGIGSEVSAGNGEAPPREVLLIDGLTQQA